MANGDKEKRVSRNALQGAGCVLLAASILLMLPVTGRPVIEVRELLSVVLAAASVALLAIARLG